jgi:hypothetical protein
MQNSCVLFFFFIMFTLNLHKTDKERGKFISQLRFFKVLK